MLKMTPAQKDAREKAESDIAILGEQIQKDQEQINEKQKEIDKQKIAYDEAVLDLKTLFDINKGERAKKESEKISSIKDDGKWHSAAEVKNSAPGWEYAIGIDKRAYTRNGADVRVYNPATVGWEAFSGKVL